MSMISLATMPAVEARISDPTFKTILLCCCAGLVASFGLIGFGIDLGPGLM